MMQDRDQQDGIEPLRSKWQSAAVAEHEPDDRNPQVDDVAADNRVPRRAEGFGHVTETGTDIQHASRRRQPVSKLAQYGGRATLPSPVDERVQRRPPTRKINETLLRLASHERPGACSTTASPAISATTHWVIC